MNESYDPYGQPFPPAALPTDLSDEAADDAADEDAADDGAGKKGKKKDKDKEQDGFGGRPAQTLMRVQYPMHMDLSSLADSKSNIMITINGGIVGFLLGSLSPKIESNPWLLLPTIVVLLGCLISLVYAILAAMPRVTTGHMTLEDVKKRNVNLLFFGNFARLTKADYVEGMSDLLRDKQMLYTRMMEDIYGLGKVLQRKFSLLRISYTAFMVGLIAGALIYIVVFVFITRVSPV